VPRIELLVVQPTPFCNIDCRYCYLPDRNSKAVVARQTLHNLFSQVFASGWVGDNLSVVWHAGEPMVLPIDFYRDAFRMIDRLKPAGVEVAHSFQTNGTLIDEAWCAFFAEERIGVGVSIDGPKQFHDRYRLSEFWRLSAAVPGKVTFIREIEHAIRQVIRPADAPFCNQLVEPFAIISMDWAGNISTFSPELLGLKNPAYEDFLLGNINQDAFADLPRRPNLTRMLADIQAGVEMCREHCEYFSVCGGGEPVNKLAENGSFASSETTYCRLTKMRATDLVLDALERVQPSGSSPREGALPTETAVCE
jgi:radical SAM protein with 4Fe4S-binding SPASM domain